MASNNNTNKMQTALPAAFVEQVGTTHPGLVESLETEPPVSVRFNPTKPYRLPASLTGSPVPWCEAGEACYLTERPVFTTDPAFHGGAYYVQEAGSMFVGWLLRRLMAQGEVPATPRVLDLCAAPGGKTTHLASIVGTEGVVVANEVIRTRAKTLAENVQKWGTGNVAVTSNDPTAFGQGLPEFFDVVVVDAPCSGEGMFRKDMGARAEWSPENVQLCAARQRRILSDVWEALRPGGILIYSTCTFNAQEDEENAAWIAEELGGELLLMEDVPAGIEVGTLHGNSVGWHFFPHRVQSEGFYAAVIRKNGSAPRHTPKAKPSRTLSPVRGQDEVRLAQWLAPNEPVEHYRLTSDEKTVYGFSSSMLETVTTLLNGRFTLLYSGVQLGEWIRESLKPSHSLALYAGVNRSAVPTAELTEAAALEYLRKGSSAALLPPDLFAEGLNLVTFQAIALGWVKRIGGRYNNLYPSSWRILHY